MASHYDHTVAQASCKAECMIRFRQVNRALDVLREYDAFSAQTYGRILIRVIMRASSESPVDTLDAMTRVLDDVRLDVDQYEGMVSSC